MLWQVHFARANALASYKSKSMVDIGRVSDLENYVCDLADYRQSAQQVLHLQTEIKLHIEFCKEYGLTPEELEKHEEDQGKRPYKSQSKVNF